jgi:hypothetical protein
MCNSSCVKLSPFIRLSIGHGKKMFEWTGLSHSAKGVHWRLLKSYERCNLQCRQTASLAEKTPPPFLPPAPVPGPPAPTCLFRIHPNQLFAFACVKVCLHVARSYGYQPWDGHLTTTPPNFLAGPRAAAIQPSLRPGYSLP